MNKKRTQEKNSNWHGGKTVTQHGYILIRKPEHPLADVRGYIYEHRLAACEKLGRLLKPKEIVHHIDGDKKNNMPENLVVISRFEHHVEHRKADKKILRFPNEKNEVVYCSCGCGETFPKYDRTGRMRAFKSGHNLHLKDYGKGQGNVR